MRAGRLFVLTLVGLGLGCGGDGGGGDGDGDGDGDIDISGLTWNACDPETRVGGFSVELADAFTGVSGKVTDGVSPIGLLETITADGACRHATAISPFCDPACTGGDLCGADDQCHPAPVSRDVGTVTIRGLAAAVEMSPIPPGFNYTNPEPLPHPGFAPGDGIAISATGGDYEFELLGAGVSPFELGATSIPIERGTALALEWTPPASSGPFKLEISLSVNRHGAGGSRIDCEVDDNGSFTIPEPLITALVDDGLSGFPQISFTRSSADSADIEPGCVDFRVFSEVIIDVDVPGIESCNLDDDCTTPGETCQPDLTCG